MELLKVAIIEDEPAEVEHIKSLLGEYEKRKGVSFAIYSFEDDSSFFSSPVAHFDVLFCDIELPGVDGMEIAKRVRSDDKDVIIVFITHIARLAIEGYAVSALQYILKPIDEDIFYATIDKIRNVIDVRDKRMISLNTGEGTVVMPIKNILYFSLSGHRLICHLPNQEISCWMSMKKAQEKLAGAPFSLCASGCLVNLQYVRAVEDNFVVIENGEKLKIAITKRKPFLSDLSLYLGS